MLPRRVDDHDSKISAYAGAWGGLVACFLYTYYMFYTFQQPDFTVSKFSPPGFTAMIAIIVGITSGYGLLWIRIIGVITFLLSCTGSIILVNLFFSTTEKSELTLGAAGVLFGLLLHIMFHPDTLEQLDYDDDD